MNHGQTFTSKDFYQSVCLLTSGIKLIDVTPSNEGYCLFAFNCNEQEANQVIDRHWSGELTTSTKDFVDAIFQLKNRMRAHRRNNAAS